MNNINIAGREIGPDCQPFIVAEIGNNHDGRLQQAMDLIESASSAGADAVKFQTYTPENLVKPDHELYNFFDRFQLPREWHGQLKEKAESMGMIFLSTPFDAASADFLAELGVPAFKIASSDLTNLPLIRRCSSYSSPILLSTGMGSLDEARIAFFEAKSAGCRQIAMLHCVSIYPTPPEESQLLAISVLKESFEIPVGFSDHSLSLTLPAAAVALGARIIEKHFTISRKLDGPDHSVALEPIEFYQMAQACREVSLALGEYGKSVTPRLHKVRKISLRGLYAAADIPEGEIIDERMIIALRPEAEFTITDLPHLLGRKTVRKIKKGDPITKSDLG